MKLDLFDYPLPPDAIAQQPAEPRDSSRLLVLHRASGRIEHRRFSEILEYLQPGDLLVLNNTRVRAARLRARKPTGAAVELLVLEVLDDLHARALVRPGRRALPGSRLIFEDGREASILRTTPDGGRLLQFSAGEPVETWLEKHGAAPLPPYIHQELQDPERYQTVYNRTLGSAAAPTAGLHFTPTLLEKALERGVGTTEVTLHVGLDTFRPIKTAEIEKHEMHSEWFRVSAETAGAVQNAKGRIIAVGTTSVRTLEASSVAPRELKIGAGVTDLYITPGCRFKTVDALLTNFHVPRSSLLVLVSALAGRELILQAYQEALAHGYRFLSLGDAMLIL